MNTGFVYVVRCENAYKIGKTTNPTHRFSHIRMNLPQNLDIVDLFYVNNIDWVEKNLHRQFKAKNLHGEWFNLDEGDLSFVREFCHKYLSERNDPVDESKTRIVSVWRVNGWWAAWELTTKNNKKMLSFILPISATGHLIREPIR